MTECHKNHLPSTHTVEEMSDAVVAFCDALGYGAISDRVLDIEFVKGQLTLRAYVGPEDDDYIHQDGKPITFEVHSSVRAEGDDEGVVVHDFKLSDLVDRVFKS